MKTSMRSMLMAFTAFGAAALLFNSDGFGNTAIGARASRALII
jgi:hypothetical protein